jgi:hypothetical protein
MASDTIADKFKALEEKVKALGPDADGALVIKISRRDQTLGGVPRASLVCTLGGASVSHAINPEVWLPRLMGGGSYTLAVFPPGMSAGAIVDGIEVATLSGESRPYPDLDAPKEEGWNGPKQIIYPLKRAVQEAFQPLNIQSPPGASNPPSTSAPQTQTSPGSGGSNPGAAQYYEDARRQQEYYAAQIRALEQRLADEARQREIAEIKAAQQRELAALRAEMKEAAAKAAVPPPPPPPAGPSIAETLKELLPIALPFVTSWMAANAERAARAEERQNKILEQMATRPVIPPEFKEMIELQRADALPMTTVLQQSAQATAAMASQMLSMAREVAEMNAGPEESAAIKAIREVGSAVQGIMSAAPASGGQKARRLPKVSDGQMMPPPPQPPVPQQQAMSDLEPAAPTLGVLARIKASLIAHEDPDQVAAACVKAFGTKEFQNALEAAQMDPRQMFENLMSAEWLVANSVYATAFGKAFMKHGQAAGIFREEGEEEEEGEEDAA